MTRRIPQSQDEWFQCAVRYLARFDRTAVQVERFLRRKGASPSCVESTTRRLRQLRYLDDAAFAKRWVESRLARYPVGKERLNAELLRSGLSDALAAEVIRETFQSIDEETLAREALRSRVCKGRQLSLRQQAAFLRRRGFDEEIIERMIERSIESKDSDV